MNQDQIILQLEKLEAKIDALSQSVSINQKQVWTLDEFSIYSGIKKSYLYKLVMQRKLPVYKPNGKSIFLKSDECIDWLLRNKIKTASEQDVAAATYVTTNP